jgi:hypothetical protein
MLEYSGIPFSERDGVKQFTGRPVTRMTKRNSPSLSGKRQDEYSSKSGV